MNILFIGGTGNISLSVSQLLIARGDQLAILNRSGNHPELSGAEFLQADIRDAQNVAAVLGSRQWDVVVNWIAFNAQDIERDIHLFTGRTRQYVFISSASCYQNPGPTPWITEKTPLENPYWDYSRAKIDAEQALMAAHHTYGFPATVVRPSFTYARVIPLAIGGWNEYTTIARIKQGKPVVVHGDGTSLWTLTHSDDFATGFIGLLGHPQSIGEAFHLTSDEFLSWNEIYQLTAQALGREAQIVHVTSDKICELDPGYRGTLLGDKSVSALFDNSKVRRLIPEFKPRIRFADGIKKCLAWFEADPTRQYINPVTDAFIDRLIATTR